jgi:hypothetical protein
MINFMKNLEALTSLVHVIWAKFWINVWIDRTAFSAQRRHKLSHQRSIPRRLGLGVRVNNGPFNPPAVKRQVYGYALVFDLEHSQVFP